MAFKILKQITLLTFSLGLFLISLLNLIATQNLLLWKISILSSEYGHDFAILSALLLIWSLRKKRNFKAILLNLFALIVFLIPISQALNLEETFRKDFQSQFQISNLGTSLVSLRQSYFGGDRDHVNFERYVFSKSKERDLNLDLYRNTQKPKASPWLLVIHGGSWEGGDSEQVPDLNWYLARHGYSVIAVTYRFSPSYQWPAQKEDMNTAMNYIVSHAKDFGIDPNRFFVLGRSAGAQIAGVFAYTPNQIGLKGYISMYPPTDLTFGYEAGDEDDILKSRSLIRRLMGGTPYERPESYKDASVIETMLQNPNPVPTLIFHGELDRLTWFKHSERLIFRLKQRKLPAVFIQLPWATHGFDFNLNGPGGQISTHLIESFMNRYAGSP